MNIEFKKYVELINGPEEAREHLKCSLSKVYKNMSGERRVSPDDAALICAKYPELSFSALLLPKTNEAA